MVPHDSRAERFARAWLGMLLGAGCLIAGAGGLAALPVGAGPPPAGPVLIQMEPEAEPGTARGEDAPAETTGGAAAAGSFNELHEALAAARARLEELSQAAEAVVASGQLRQELAELEEENQRLRAQLDAGRAGDRELDNARQAAEARVLDLSRDLEDVTAQAQRIDEELIAVRWENAQLNTSLAQTRAARQEDQVQARAVQEALRAQIEALEADGAGAAAALARLRDRLEESEQRLMAASSARSDAEARLAELRTRLQDAEQETASAAERLATVEEQLSAAQRDAASAQQDRGLAAQRASALQSERDELGAALATAADRLARTEAANERLESQVAELRQAAGTATDVARHNLLAVEEQIRALNEALGTIAPDAGTPPSAMAATGEPGSDAPDARASAVSAAAASDQEAGATETAAGTAVDLETLKGASPPADEEASLALLAGLPLEQRLHVQGLLADLNGTMDEQGLKMVVPGGVLFALNGEEVQDSAHDTLAKVAEIIDMYADRPVQIIGHTDALGDAAYNKALSERRAALIKQFFIDRFDLEEARLATEGMGEAHPIASNATLEGRRANRRVEVLIRD